MAGLHFDITGDNSNFLRKLDEARNGVRSTSKQIEESGTSIEQMFGRIAKGATALGAGFTAKEIVSNIVRVRGEFQQLEVAFKTMLGSKEKADTLMNQLVKTAATTPFDLQSVASGARQLLAYGTSAEDVNGTLVQLGDIAAGLSIPLNDLVWLYGTTMTQGRLFTQDLRQFQGRGIPLADELAKQFGVAKDKVGELVTAGKVGFPEVQKAIVAMTSDGGKFGGLMEAQSKTITGQISNIGDSISTMYNNIGKSSEGFINDALSGVSYLVANYEQIGKTVLELAATYGVYKAVLMSVAAYQSVATGITYSVEIAELSKLIPLEQQSANQDVIAAVASGKLTQSKAEQVIALRAEVNAKLQSLQATAAQTAAENASAMSTYKSATQRMIVAKQNMALAQSQMQIAINSGTAEEIAAAKKNAQTASLELNNAAVAKNTAHKSLNIAATNSKSASEALNTLETGKNSVAQTVNTTSTNILTTAKTRLAAASKALGLSMLANPYVLVAAAAVGLGYAIYKTITAETELDKAHKRLNDATSDVEKGLASEVSKLTSMERKLAETKKGTEEYNSIKKTIVDNYGQYYKGLDGEIERVGNLSTVYGKLVEAMRLSIGQRKFESFFKAEQDNLDKTIGEKLDTAYETLIDKYGKTKGANLYNQFFDSAMRGESLSPSSIKDLQNATFMDVKWGSNAKDGIIDFRNSVFDLRSEISKETKATEEVLDEYKSKFQITEEEVAKILDGDSSSTNEQPKDNKTLKQLLLDIDASKSKIKELQDQANKGLINSDKIKEEQDVLSKLTSDYKNRTGKEYGSTKQDKAADKLREQQEKYNLLLDKQKLDQARSVENLQIQVDQARINAMDEGSKKTLEQMELNFEKEMQAIDRQKEDLLRKKIEDERAAFETDPKNKKKTFDPTGIVLSDGENKQFDELYKAQIESFEKDKRKLELESMRDYLKEYGTFQQKKLAIAEEYAEKIKNAQNEWERKSLEEQKKSALSGVDLEAINKKIDWQGVFGDFTGMLESQLKDTLSGLKEYVKTDKFKSSSDTDKKTIYDAIEKLQSVTPGGEGTLNFSKIQQQMDNLGAAINRLQTATLSQEIAYDNLSKAQKNYDNALKSGDKGSIDNAKQALDLAKLGADAASNAYKSAEVDVQNFGNELRSTGKDTVDGLNAIADGFQGFSSRTLPGIFKGLQSTIQGLNKLNIGGAVGDAVGTLSKTLSSAGVIGQIISAILSILDVLKDGIGPLIAGIIDSILGAIDGILENILSGDLFVQIFDSIKSGIGNILNTITYGGFNSWFNIGGNAKETAETIDRLTNSNEALKTSIDGLTKKMDESNGAKSIEYYQKAKDAQSRSDENYRQILDAQMNYNSAHHSNAYYWDLDRSSLNQVNKLLGTSLKNSWDDFSRLTAEQMNEIRTQLPDIWSEMIDEGKYGDRFKDDWNNYADQAGKIEELTEKINESIAQISFDSLRDSFVDTLMDMDSSAEDFANNFEEYLMRAMLNFSMGDLVDEEMKVWYNNWAKTIGDQKGELTPEQIEQYKKEWDGFVQKGIDKRNELAELTGYDSSNSSSSQSSTQKSFAAMSQDTGDELNGRFTALQISNEEIKNSMLAMLSGVNLISTTSTANGITLMEIRNVAMSSNSYLEDIAGFQKKIVTEFGSKLDSINKNIEKKL